MTLPRTRSASVWEVIPFLPLPPAGRQAFSYLSPATTALAPGMLVRIPFGRRTVDGLTLRATKRPRLRSPLKRVTRVTATYPLFAPEELAALRDLATISLESTALLTKAATLVRKPLARAELPPVFERQRTPPPAFRWTVAWKSLEAVLPTACHGQVLVLVPEIAVAREAVTILQNRKLPAVFFAQTLPLRERRRVLQQLCENEGCVIVATHPGIFLPLPALTHIIVAEAALSSHRQWDLHPRYDARIGATLLARLHGVPLTLQSSLPSTDLVFLDRNGAREALRTFPPIQVIPRSRSDPLLLPHTMDVIRATLRERGSVFLFHDIVGAERWFACDTCGAALRCPACGGMVERVRMHLRCRACGAPVGEVPHFCPRCRSPHFGPRRIGTTSVLNVLKHVLPDVPVLRLDRETVHRRQRSPTPSSPHPTPSIIIGTERAFAVLARKSVNRAIILEADRILEEDRPEAADRFLAVLARVAETQSSTEPTILQTTRGGLSLLQRLGRSELFSSLEDELADREHLGYPPFTALLFLERSVASAARGEHLARRLIADLADRFPGLRMGARVAGQRNPRVSVMLRGSLAALSKALTRVPSGWSTDPYIPLSLLLNDKNARRRYRGGT